MQQKWINNISVTSKLVSIFILIVVLLMAKSLMLLGVVTILVAISVFVSNKNVKLYVEVLKNALFLLLFFSVIYIMFFRDIIGLFTCLYKLVLIIVLLKSFKLRVSFVGLSNALYTLFYPLKKFKKYFYNLDKMIYIFVSYLYFCDYFFESGIYIKNVQLFRGKKTNDLKYKFLPSLFYSSNKVLQLEENLNLNFYELKKEKQDMKSMCVVICFIILFVITLFKEVIL